MKIKFLIKNKQFEKKMRFFNEIRFFIKIIKFMNEYMTLKRKPNY